MTAWRTLTDTDTKEAVNPYRRAKRQMMRECHLSPRQWRKFRKRKQREAKEEMRNGIRSAG